MAQQPGLTDLQQELARLYPRQADSIRIVRAAGLNEHDIEFDNRATTNWSNILSEADKQGKVLNIVREARKQYDTPALRAFETPTSVPQPVQMAQQPKISPTRLTQLLRQITPDELQDVANEYAEIIPHSGGRGLLARLTAGGQSAQSSELVTHASQRETYQALQKLETILRSKRPDLL